VTTTERPLPQESRVQGKHAGLERSQILDVARSLDPSTLTMKAVADRLGVDRKALHYYVKDRDTLLGLVAEDIFSASFSPTQITAHSRWQDACRDYAHGVARSAIAVGALSDHLRLDKLLITTMLETTEVVLGKLVAAGFDDETAVRSLALLTNICVAYARDIEASSRGAQHPRLDLLQGALKANPSRTFENLARIAASATDTYDHRQLDHSIDVFLRGTESLLPPAAG
jgi:TetR/AcrR family tetracycline transcriptional repressor